MSKKIFGIDLDSIIMESIREDMPSDERQKQDRKAKELSSFKSSKKSSSSKKEDVDEAPEAIVKPNKKPTPTVKASKLIDFINVIRSGQSLKDEQTRKDFQAYFNSLSGSERIALYSFLEAIADITSGINDSKDIANEPQPDDYGVKTVKIDQTKGKKKKSKNDSSEEAPIIVGEASNIFRELKILKRNKTFK